MAVPRLLLQALLWVVSLAAPPGRYTRTLVRVVLSRVSMEAGRPLQSGAWTHKMSMSSASTAWWVCGCVWVCGVWGVGGGGREEGSSRRGGEGSSVGEAAGHEQGS